MESLSALGLRLLLALVVLGTSGCHLHELLWPDPPPSAEKCYLVVRSWTPNATVPDTTYHRYEIPCA